MIINEGLNPFDVLKGEQLSSVIFVQDYLQLDFDGSRLTCFIWPQVSVEGVIFKFGDDQYRNKLCGLIAKKVKEIVFVADVILEIILDNESSLELELVLDSPKKLDEKVTFKDVEGNWSFL